MMSCEPSAKELKSYPIKLLNQFVNCEVQISLRNTDEHLTGILSKYRQGNGLYIFNCLKRVGHDKIWSMRQTYNITEFTDTFMSADEPKPQYEERQRKAEDELQTQLNDVSTNLVSVDDTNVSNLIGDIQPEVIVNPDVKELEFEVIDFSFVLDQDDYECVVSNDVTRFTDPKDPLLKETIYQLRGQNQLGLALLPFSKADRMEPIDFILIGCELGTFIFTVSTQMMSKLKDILESKQITKIMHDCFVSTARIFWLFNIDMENVDDTLILLLYHESKYIKRLSTPSSRLYSNCVKTWLAEILPWAKFDRFYERCGKGKLLAIELDETGRSYARSLVMLLPELRIEAIKHIFYPIIQQQFCYANVLRYASATEYADIKSYDLMAPEYLVNPDLGNPDAMDAGGAEILSRLLLKKFSYFNKFKTFNRSNVSTQTINPTPTLKPAHNTTDSTQQPSCSFQTPIRKTLKSENSSGNSTDSEHYDRKKYSSYSTSNELSSPESCSNHSNQSHVIVNGQSIPRAFVQDSPTSQEVDWDKIPARIRARNASSAAWGIEQPNIWPAGCNY